ncbi:MAG: hypothetical protein BGO88_16955 [Flavobacterium sp. 38-13]|uniref:hypothetical protein n=1 Tax=Flavobacterium sp. 38-13 TaxID=1896168 RepID=UPI00095AEFA7|nr:hypothetical protein [Flavobacterium sp. 38-13]OJX52241.1 MAG: hypothetical protein BGO88_16955 [Flavobacterium sp. 38-13]
MKDIALKFSVLIFFLFNSFSVLAQNPEEVPEEVDGPIAPISDHLWLLALVGLVYIFCKYSPKTAKEKS